MYAKKNVPLPPEMEENGRYIVIIAGAVVLMALGILGAYKWEQHKHITRSSATLAMQQEFDNSPSGASGAQKPDSVPAEQKTSSADSLAQMRREWKETQKKVRGLAEREGYRWQQALTEHRFREPAERCMERLEEEAQVVRDTIEIRYAQHAKRDSLMFFFDEELDSWRSRLREQVEMLPTARQALEAEQITEKEYEKLKIEN